MRNPPLNRIVCLLIALAFFASCRGGMRTTTTNQIREDLESGRFQKALDRCQGEHRKNPKDAGTIKQYIEAIEHIKVFADKTFQRENFALAGSAYALLLKRFSQFGSFAGMLSFERNYLALRIRVSQTRFVERQISSPQKVENIQRAIDLYKDLHQQFYEDPLVQRDCITLLELIKTHADLSFEKNDLVLAGCLYRLLLRNFAAFNPGRHSLSYSRELLNVNIKKCQKRLFENGLEQYRSGNLNTSISIWKSILTFDPENPEVKKALNTAVHQSRSLERDKANDVK